MGQNNDKFDQLKNVPLFGQPKLLILTLSTILIILKPKEEQDLKCFYMFLISLCNTQCCFVSFTEHVSLVSIIVSSSRQIC